MRWDWLEATRALGVAALLDKDRSEAVEHLRAVWDHTQREGVLDPGAFPAGPDLVEALVETRGRTTRRATVVDALAEAAEAQDHPWARRRRPARRRHWSRSAGDVRTTDEAGEALEAAAAAYRELGLAFDEARTLLALGRAAATGEEVGSGARRPRARRGGASRRSGRPGGPTTPAPSSSGWAPGGRAPPVRLTATERRVAELAVEGLANKEIARTLVVTVNTVEFHLRNTYAKLGIRSRVELAARLREVDERPPRPDARPARVLGSSWGRSWGREPISSGLP